MGICCCFLVLIGDGGVNGDMFLLFGFEDDDELSARLSVLFLVDICAYVH